MNKKLVLALCLIGLSGCSWISSRYGNNECFGPNCGDEYYMADMAEEEVYEPAALPEICQESGDPSLCAKDPFVNFTRTPADFRRFGERTPRDHRISQAAAGNNISASIPPSIEDEIVVYQEQVADDAALMANALDDDSYYPAREVKKDTSKKVRARPGRKHSARRAKSSGESRAPAAGTDLDLVLEDECIEEEDGEDCVVMDRYKRERTGDRYDRNRYEREEAYAEDKPYSTPTDDPVRDWFADEGQNLKALLTQWSEESGWRLVWNTNRNYVLSAGAIFRGRFADVSSALIRAFARARPAPIATFYNGNRVLVVETMEDENAFD